MHKKTRQTAVQQVRHRMGEGPLVDAKTSQIVRPDGSIEIGLNIDVGSAPVPDRRYVAEVVSVIYKNESLVIAFGQQKITGNGLRSLLIIHLTTIGAIRFVNSLNEMQTPSISELAEIAHSQPDRLYEITDEPEQTVAFMANIVSSGISGREACLDIFHVSPFSMANAGRTSKVGVDPVVRVDMHLSVLLALHKALMDLSPEFPRHERE